MLPAIRQTIRRLTHPNDGIERRLDQIQSQNRQIIDHLKVSNYYAAKRDKERSK